MMPTRAGKSKRCSVLMAIGLRPSPLAAPMIATMSYAAVEAQNAQAVMVVPLRSRALIPAKCSERIQGESARSWVAPVNQHCHRQTGTAAKPILVARSRPDAAGLGVLRHRCCR